VSRVSLSPPTTITGGDHEHLPRGEVDDRSVRDPLDLSVVGIYWQGFGNALSLPYTGLSLVKVDLVTVVLPDRQESNEFSQNDYGRERRHDMELKAYDAKAAVTQRSWPIWC
jgi:hypothetical protein